MEAAWNSCLSTGIQIIDKQPLMGGRLHINQRSFGFGSCLFSRAKGGVE